MSATPHLPLQILGHECVGVPTSPKRHDRWCGLCLVGLSRTKSSPSHLRGRAGPARRLSTGTPSIGPPCATPASGVPYGPPGGPPGDRVTSGTLGSCAPCGSAMPAAPPTARTSTPSARRCAACGVGARRIYVDHGLTGTSRERPGLREALAACRAGDTMVVARLDRLARSLPNVRDIADELTAREVRLDLGGAVYDPTDPVGRMCSTWVRMAAELEADLIRARTREGMPIARAKGHLRGRQPNLTRVRRGTSSSSTRRATRRRGSWPSCSAWPARRCTGRSSGPGQAASAGRPGDARPSAPAPPADDARGVWAQGWRHYAGRAPGRAVRRWPAARARWPWAAVAAAACSTTAGRPG